MRGNMVIHIDVNENVHQLMVQYCLDFNDYVYKLGMALFLFLSMLVPWVIVRGVFHTKICTPLVGSLELKQHYS